MGTQLPHEKGQAPPTFQPMSMTYCGQTAGWIRIPFDTEVGLGPGDIVLDGYPAGPQGKEHSSHPPPTFRPMFMPRSRISPTAEL